MKSGLSSEDEGALVQWSMSADSSLNQIVSKAGNPSLEGDVFLLELHEDSNREKVTTLVAEALQQTNVPLSMYPF